MPSGLPFLLTMAQRGVAKQFSKYKNKVEVKYKLHVKWLLFARNVLLINECYVTAKIIH